MCEVRWGYSGDIELTFKLHRTFDRLCYVAVYGPPGMGGGVTLKITRRPKPRCGLVFQAKTLNAGLDQIHQYFTEK